jgi:hypothetical protein
MVGNLAAKVATCGRAGMDDMGAGWAWLTDVGVSEQVVQRRAG